jgi:hypothetical protein
MSAGVRSGVIEMSSYVATGAVVASASLIILVIAASVLSLVLWIASWSARELCAETDKSLQKLELAADAGLRAADE